MCVCVWPHYEAAVLAVVGVVTAAVVAAVVVACMKMSKDYDYFKSINKVWQSHKKCTQFNETSLSTNCPSRDKFWFYIRLLHMSPAIEYSWARTFFRTVIWLVSFYIYIYVCKGITIIQLKNFYICTVYSETEIQSNSFTIHSERTAQCWCCFFCWNISLHTKRASVKTESTPKTSEKLNDLNNWRWKPFSQEEVLFHGNLHKTA